MEDCLFCKIISGEIPSKKIYEDELTYVFEDIAPTAPIHYLVIPKQHISKLDEITPENSAVIAHIYEVIAKLAKDLDIKDGFRVVSNCGEQAGQSVFHIHFHLLAGRPLAWPVISAFRILQDFFSVPLAGAGTTQFSHLRQRV